MNDVNSITATQGDLSLHNNDVPHLVNVLWTGGLDSTFRMLELSRLDVSIQPYYLCDQRTSEPHELKAIDAISQEIINHPQTRCQLMPLNKVRVADLPPDESVTNAYHRLSAVTKLGSQFDWLARFAKQIPGIELGMEKSEISKGYNCVRSFGRVILIDKGPLSYYVLDKNQSSKDLVRVMGNFHFPYRLFHTTKLEEVELYKELGFEKTLYKTWFCHTPINNKPCGVCHPCESVIEEGLSFRLPPSALIRYQRHVRYGNSFIYEKLFRFRLKIEKQVYQHLISPPSLLTNKALSHRI